MKDPKNQIQLAPSANVAINFENAYHRFRRLPRIQAQIWQTQVRDDSDYHRRC